MFQSQHECASVFAPSKAYLIQEVKACLPEKDEDSLVTSELRVGFIVSVECDAGSPADTDDADAVAVAAVVAAAVGVGAAVAVVVVTVVVVAAVAAVDDGVGASASEADATRKYVN